MTKRLLFLALPLFASLVLTGCIGSDFLYGDDSPKGEFPSLHSVPDRPITLKTQETFDAERQKIEQSHQQALKEAKHLRREAGLTQECPVN
tara:strand:- start:4178 stop:4450 length:273 start_codon:yes stop_codon:yes gene_type:complete